MREESVNFPGTRPPFVRLRCVKCGWLWWLAPRAKVP